MIRMQINTTTMIRTICTHRLRNILNLRCQHGLRVLVNAEHDVGPGSVATMQRIFEYENAHTLSLPDNPRHSCTCADIDHCSIVSTNSKRTTDHPELPSVGGIASATRRS